MYPPLPAVHLALGGDPALPFVLSIVESPPPCPHVLINEQVSQATPPQPLPLHGVPGGDGGE